MLGYRRENEEGKLRKFSLNVISNSVFELASNFGHEM
jgi:hypothetical protein